MITEWRTSRALLRREYAQQKQTDQLLNEAGRS
jgi:hypothetical protein